MIVFDLRCPHAHVFEGWFGSSADFETQRARGLLSCPICGATPVEKAVMAPAVTARSNRADDETPAAAKARLAALAHLQAELEARCIWVGDRFADEARRLHAGGQMAGAAPVGICGEATREEVQELAEEGIPVARLPFPSRRKAQA